MPLERGGFERFLIEKMNISEKDVEIYMRLLRQPSSVKDLSICLKRPKTTINDSIKRLEQDGFVDHKLSGGPRKNIPKMYRAVPPREALKDYLEAINELKADLDGLDQMLELQAETPIENVHDEIWIREDQRSSLNTIHHMIERAKKEIFIFGTDFSWMFKRPAIVQALKNKKKQGCKVVLIGTFNNDRGKRAEKEFKSNNLKINKTDLPFSPICIIDSETLMIGHKSYSDEYHCEFIKNKNTIKNYMSLLNKIKGDKK